MKVGVDLVMELLCISTAIGKACCDDYKAECRVSELCDGDFFSLIDPLDVEKDFFLFFICQPIPFQWPRALPLLVIIFDVIMFIPQQPTEEPQNDTYKNNRVRTHKQHTQLKETK